jgi:AraC-like DNA-binding protein
VTHEARRLAQQPLLRLAILRDQERVIEVLGVAVQAGRFDAEAGVRQRRQGVQAGRVDADGDRALGVCIHDERQVAAHPPGLLAALYDYLLKRVRAAPTLERTALDFGVSPATLKRQLLRHHTHFQAELDQVHTHVALWLFQARRLDNEAAAAYLGFHDAANLRRSFKRWTGITPGPLRLALDAAL